MAHPASLPAAEARPRSFYYGLVRDHVVVRMLCGGRARVIRQDAKERADRKAAELDRSAVALGDDAVLLVRFGYDEVVDRPSSQIAYETVTLIDALLRRSAVARKRHPPRIGDDPVAV